MAYKDPAAKKAADKMRYEQKKAQKLQEQAQIERKADNQYNDSGEALEASRGQNMDELAAIRKNIADQHKKITELNQTRAELRSKYIKEKAEAMTDGNVDNSYFEGLAAKITDLETQTTIEYDVLKAFKEQEFAAIANQKAQKSAEYAAELKEYQEIRAKLNEDFEMLTKTLLSTTIALRENEKRIRTAALKSGISGTPSYSPHEQFLAHLFVGNPIIKLATIKHNTQHTKTILDRPLNEHDPLVKLNKERVQQ